MKGVNHPFSQILKNTPTHTEAAICSTMCGIVFSVIPSLKRCLVQLISLKDSNGHSPLTTETIKYR